MTPSVAAPGDTNPSDATVSEYATCADVQAGSDLEAYDQCHSLKLLLSDVVSQRAEQPHWAISRVRDYLIELDDLHILHTSYFHYSFIYLFYFSVPW